MQSLTESFIRSSFINASPQEIEEMTLPPAFDFLRDADWDELDYLGWRDPRFARRAYAVLPRPGGDPIGVVFRQAGALPRSRMMCNWCRDFQLPNEVVFWSARRASDDGQSNSTVGVLVCSDFRCSHNVRNDPPPAYTGFDVSGARARRIAGLQAKVTGFAEMLLSGR